MIVLPLLDVFIIATSVLIALAVGFAFGRLT